VFDYEEELKGQQRKLACKEKVDRFLRLFGSCIGELDLFFYWLHSFRSGEGKCLASGACDS